MRHFRGERDRLQIATTRVTVRQDCSRERARVRASGCRERGKAPHACATSRHLRRASSDRSSAGAAGTRRPVARVRQVLVRAEGEVGGRGRFCCCLCCCILFRWIQIAWFDTELVVERRFMLRYRVEGRRDVLLA